MCPFVIQKAILRLSATSLSKWNRASYVSLLDLMGAVCIPTFFATLAESKKLCGMAGKSTMLKLLLRLYDPTEGVILINGIDIRVLRISDVRRVVSVLFQDYNIFPLSVGVSYIHDGTGLSNDTAQIRDNIAVGDTSHSQDNDRIFRAAELAGATDIIERLPHKFESYIDRPVQNFFSRLPEGTQSLFGAKDMKFYGRYGMSTESHELSGGESQRLAL